MNISLDECTYCHLIKAGLATEKRRAKRKYTCCNWILFTDSFSHGFCLINKSPCNFSLYVP